MSLEANAGKDVDVLLLSIARKSNGDPGASTGGGVFSLLVPIKNDLLSVQKSSLVVRQILIRQLIKEEMQMYDTELRQNGKCFSALALDL